MSTKTNFKRIALVAVAALGLGVLSSVPSQAVGNADSLVLATGTQNTMAAGGGTIADSGTAATATFSYLAAASVNDTYTLTVSLKSAPAGNTALPFLMVDTYSVGTTTGVIGVIDTDALIGTGAGSALVQFDTAAASNATVYIQNPGATAGVVTAKFKVIIDRPTVAGSYVVNIKGGPTSGHAAVGGSDNIVADGQDVTITVSGLVTTASQSTSKSQMTLGATYAGATGATGVDSAVAVAATASETARAVVRVVLLTSTSLTTASESITATTSVGTIGLLSGGVRGKSVVLPYTSGATGTDLGIYSDGTAGTATITLSSTNVTFASRTVTFYSTTVSKIVATKATNTLSVGAGNTSAVLGKATDANGITVGSNTAVYAYSSNTAVVSDSGTACTYNSTYQIHECTLTGVAAGTATITLRNSGTAGAAATVSSTEAISVTVNSNPAASLKMEFDKATYAPGQKGYLKVWAVDSAGKPVGPQTLSNLLNANGISTSATFSNTGTTAAIPSTTVSYALQSVTPLLGGAITSTEPINLITVYMPVAGGTVEVSATGGASLPAAAQAVAVKASATVTDNAAAALAAVTALATTVASLRTLITTLTNLVLKIQKKVKA